MLSLIFCFTILNAQAQVAIKAGVNFANMNFESDDDDIQDLAKNGAVKFTVGAAFILPLAENIALQPEFLFTQKGAETTYKFLGSETTQDITYNYIDIPVLLRLGFGETTGEGLGFYINGGPYVGYALSGKVKTSSLLGDSEVDYTFDDKDDQRRVDFGLSLGAGVTIGNLMFDARYNHGTNNLLDGDADNGNDGNFDKLQHRGLAFTAGLIF